MVLPPKLLKVPKPSKRQILKIIREHYEGSDRGRITRSVTLARLRETGLTEPELRDVLSDAYDHYGYPV